MNKLAFNWKMNPDSLVEVARLLEAINKANTSVARSEIILFPPSLYIPFIQNSGVMLSLGLQDISSQPSGAYTGQLSAKMAKNMGLDYVLIGHSETRLYQHYTSADIAQKLVQAIDQELTPILCLGYQAEPLAEEEALNYLQQEIQAILKPCRELLVDQNLIVAYEPIGSIGTGIVPSSEHIEMVAILIKKSIQELLWPQQSRLPSVLYGGSINRKNIQTLKNIASLSGFLIGGASVDLAQIPYLH